MLEKKLMYSDDCTPSILLVIYTIYITLSLVAYHLCQLIEAKSLVITRNNRPLFVMERQKRRPRIGLSKNTMNFLLMERFLNFYMAPVTLR